MNKFIVRVEIEVEADHPWQAAGRAYQAIANTYGTGQVWKVRRKDGSGIGDLNVDVVSIRLG